VSRTPSPDEARRAVEAAAGAPATEAESHLPAVPEYPVRALTGPLRELVDAGTAAGLPAALVAGAGLGALAVVCGRADLEVYDTWIVRPALWIPLIAPPSGGKTPAITMARRVLRRLDADAWQELAEQRAEWDKTPASKREEGEEPQDMTRLLGDVTVEMVARWLSAGDGTGGVDTDELSDWLRSLSRYRGPGGTDAARWLALWSSQPWRYQRVGSSIDLLVPRPLLTICGGIQTSLVHLLGPQGDGMRPRWLPHVSLTTDLDPGPGKPTPAWDDAIMRLYAARASRTWTMADPELTIWRAAQRRWKIAQRAGPNLRQSPPRWPRQTSSAPGSPWCSPSRSVRLLAARCRPRL
jgi:Protein of unknown function (DUF3987)